MKAVAIIAPPLLGDTIIITPHLGAFQAEGISVYFLAPPEICELVDTFLASDIHTIALPPAFFTTDKLPSARLKQLSTDVMNIDIEAVFDHLGNENAFDLIKNLNCRSFGVSCVAKHPYTDIVTRKQVEHWQFDTRSASECYADLYTLAGIHLTFDPPRFRVSTPTKQTSTSILVNPGAGSQTKRWPLDNFIEVAESLAATCGSQINFLFGPKESDLLGLVRSKIRFTAHNGTAFSLPVLAEFIASHDLLITNDTAVMHLGAAFGVSTVAIFTGGFHQPTKWFPYDLDRHSVFVGDQITPPNQSPNPLWAKNVLPSEIIASAQQLLGIPENIGIDRA
jgi:hypothetical protein